MSSGLAQCSALVTNLDESLRNVSMTACSPGGRLAFEWQQFLDGSAELRVVRNVSGDSRALQERGVHRIDPREIAIVAKGTEFEHQVYVGPPNFTIPMTTVV